MIFVVSVKPKSTPYNANPIEYNLSMIFIDDPSQSIKEQVDLRISITLQEIGDITKTESKEAKELNQ